MIALLLPLHLNLEVAAGLIHPDAPGERYMMVGEDARLLAVESASRVLAVASDPRTLSVEADPRTLAVPPDPREMQCSRH